MEANDVFFRWTICTPIHKSDGFILCQCLCGVKRMVSIRNLKAKKTKSCGCLQKETTLKRCLIDITGRKFGRLTVTSLESIYSPKNGKWRCQCDCGNTCMIRAGDLKNGKTKSCGCLQKEKASSATLIDLTSKKFGKLTVLQRDSNDDRKSPKWICLCECGNQRSVRGRDLKNGKTQSCGCLNSQGELLVKNWLNEQNISYVYQWKFENSLFKFDFCIPNCKLLIEFNGRQHYEPVARFGGLQNFNVQIRRDKQKALLAKKHGYKLMSIPYNHDINAYFNSILVELSHQKAQV